MPAELIPPATKWWWQVPWQEAERDEIDLGERPDIQGPVNEAGEECPWPWDPHKQAGKVEGAYDCPYCGGLVYAGDRHPDLRNPDSDQLDATPW